VHFKEHQFLYLDGDNAVFMDNETFEQITLSREAIGEGFKFLKEGMNVSIYFDGDEPIYAELPVTVELEVTYTEPGLRGDTATRTLKPATLENGAEVKVPCLSTWATGSRLTPVPASTLNGHKPGLECLMIYAQASWHTDKG
jgi:elongation factor P